MAANHTTRRAVLAVAFAARVSAQTQSSDLEREFGDLVTDFLVAWNEVSICILRRAPNVKKCAAFEQAYERMTSHPGWVSMRQKRK